MREAGLVRAIARGSERALADLYRLYAAVLYPLVFAILRDRQDAEEVLQEVFLQVWRNAGRFDAGRGSVYRWLVTLARSRAIDRTRGGGFWDHRATESAGPRVEALRDGADTDQLHACLVLERAAQVRRVFQEIPEEQQEVLRLAYFHGLTQAEIATHLGIPLGTVKTRTRQALIRLERLLAPEWTP